MGLGLGIGLGIGLGLGSGLRDPASTVPRSTPLLAGRSRLARTRTLTPTLTLIPNPHQVLLVSGRSRERMDSLLHDVLHDVEDEEGAAAGA